VADLRERVVLALKQLRYVGALAQLGTQALEHHIAALDLVVLAVHDRHAAARELTLNAIPPRDLLAALRHDG
jgi:hypothetical protein